MDFKKLIVWALMTAGVVSSAADVPANENSVPAESVPAGENSVFAGESASVPVGENLQPKIIEPSREFPLYTTTRTMKGDAVLTSLYLERLHISHKTIAEIDKKEFLERYITGLDAAHMIFTAREIRAFQDRFAGTLNKNFENGNLYPAFEIYKNFLEKYTSRVAWIRKELAGTPMNLQQNASLNLDRDEEPWPETTAELDELWRKRLANDLINELLGELDSSGTENGGNENLAGTPKIAQEKFDAAAEKIASRYEKIAKNIVLEPWEVEEIYLNTLTAEFDPHTTFFTSQSMQDFQIAMRSALCGIGAVLFDDDGYCTVREIMPGGPVERCEQIEVGDRIVAVGIDQNSDEMLDVIGMRLNRIVHMLRGKKGETVRLLIESGTDHAQRHVVVLQRDEIKITEQLASAKLIDVPAAGTENSVAGTQNPQKTVPVGIINLPSFYGKDTTETLAFSTSEDVRELLQKLKKLGAQAIVLDLRNNGGGYLNEAIDLVELFLGGNVPVVRIKDAAGKVTTYKTGNTSIFGTGRNLVAPAGTLWDGPMIVLTSKASASASEIVAGALSDNGRALIVGDPKTHGKGSVQEIKPYSLIDQSQKASIKVTRSKWYAPSGNSIQLRGVPADIEIPSTYSVLPIAESDLKNPLPWDSVPSALAGTPKYAWLKAPISRELISQLAENSKRRQAELQEFQTLAHSIAWFAARQQDKSLSLDINERFATREDDKALYTHVKNALKNYAENFAFPTQEIKLDSTLAKEKIEAEEIAAGTKKSKKKSSADRLAVALTIPGVNPKKTKSGAGTAAGGNALFDDGEDDEAPNFDIILREAARIAADWVEMLPKES